MGDRTDGPTYSPEVDGNEEQTTQRPHTHLFRGNGFGAPPEITRFEHETDGRFKPANTTGAMCIFTAGVILDELNRTIDIADRRAGCGFVFRPGTHLHITDRALSFRLERKGPHLQRRSPSRFRAHLRAALAAIAYKPWYEEGWTTLVIATSSKYVWAGIYRLTGSEPGQWKRECLNGMSNGDLWYDLLLQIDIMRTQGNMHVAFWWLPENWNQEAIGCADWAARYLGPVEEWSDVVTQGVARRPLLSAESEKIKSE